MQLNTGQLGAQFAQNDVNAERVWIQGVTGCNVTIAVVDTGIDCSRFNVSLHEFTIHISARVMKVNYMGLFKNELLSFPVQA